MCRNGYVSLLPIFVQFCPLETTRSTYLKNSGKIVTTEPPTEKTSQKVDRYQFMFRYH